jgi:phenylacetate-CoA ligase
LLKRHNNILSARLIVERNGDQDVMRLQVVGEDLDLGSIESSLRDLTKLGGHVEQVSSLPNDGKVISDERDYEA